MIHCYNVLLIIGAQKGLATLMARIVNKWLKIVQQIASACYPLANQCVLCLQPSRTPYALCKACETYLPWIKNGCARCGIALINDKAYCPHCIQKTPPYERLSALFDYEWPVNTFLGKLKYGGNLPFGKILGHLLASHLSPSALVDTVVALPLHPHRQKERGFNQCLELAQIVAKQLNLPLDRRSCTKITNTTSQALLTGSARLALTANAFKIAKEFKAKHVLVIEDVVTTQTTVNAFTMALKNHGVSTVEIWSVCRTSL